MQPKLSVKNLWNDETEIKFSFIYHKLINNGLHLIDLRTVYSAELPNEPEYQLRFLVSL